MSIRISVLIISFFITSCLGGLFVVGTAGLVVYDQRNLVTLEKDARIFYLTRNNIVKDKRFVNSRVVIVSFNETVLLLGQTPSAFLKFLAEKKVKQNDAKHIYNGISIAYPLSFSNQAYDSLITSQIRALLLAEKGLKSGSIRVVTENRNVYLMGKVSNLQATLATNIARQIHGVKKVIKIFE